MRNAPKARTPLSNRKPMEPSSQVGYTDALRGAPFMHDRFTREPEQRNYERGRLRVLEMRADGFAPPPLTPAGCVPLRALEWMRAHDDTIPVPANRQPACEGLTFGSTLDRRGFPKRIPTYCER